MLSSVTTETDGGAAFGGSTGSEQPAIINGVQVANKIQQIRLSGEQHVVLSISIPWLTYERVQQYMSKTILRLDNTVANNHASFREFCYISSQPDTASSPTAVREPGTPFEE
jgi:hypothetical protein